MALCDNCIRPLIMLIDVQLLLGTMVVAPFFAPCMSRWILSSHSILTPLVASIVMCLIALAFTLVCFALKIFLSTPPNRLHDHKRVSASQGA